MTKRFGMLRQRWMLFSAAGFAMALALFGEGSIFLSHFDTSTYAVMPSSDPLSGGITVIATLIVAAVFAGHVDRMGRGDAGPIVAAVICLAGYILLYSKDFGLGSQVVYDAGGLVVGIGSTLLVIFWADLIIPLGAQRSSACFALALLAVVASYLVASVVIDPGGMVIAFLFCAACPFLLITARRSIAELEPEHELVDYRANLPLWCTVLSLVLYGVVMACIQKTGETAGVAGDFLDTISGLAPSIGIALTALVILAGLRFLKGDNLVFYRLTILALISISLYAATVFSGNWYVVTMVFMTCTRLLIFVLIITLFSTSARTLSPVRLFSMALAVFLLSDSVVTRLIIALGGFQTVGIALQMLVIVALLALCATTFSPIVLGDPSYTSAEADVDETAGHEARISSFGPARRPAAEEIFAASIRSLSAEHGLTPRETDVLAALARGRTAVYIADTLVVSKETARTHIRHVYQKLDVHSREELMALIDDRQASDR